MRKQDAVPEGGQLAVAAKNNVIPKIQTTDSITVIKRSTAMHNTFSFIRKGILAFLALFLVSSLALSQNLVIQDGATFTGTGTWNIGGNIDKTAETDPVTIGSSGSTVNLNGTGAQSIGVGGVGALTFWTLNNSDGSTKTLFVNVTVNTLIDATDASTVFDISTLKLTLGDAITASGGGAYDFAENASEVDYAKTSANQTLYGTTYGLLTLSGASTFSLSGDVTAGNTVSHTGGALTVDNDFTANAGYSFNEIATISAAQLLTLGTTGSITTLTDIAATGQLVNGTGLLTVATLSDNHGTITASANGGAVTFTNAATTNNAITGGAGIVLFSNTLSTSTGTLTAGAGGMQFDNTTTVNSGTITAATGTSLDFNGSVGNSGTIQLTGTGSATFAGNFTASGTLDLAVGSNWTYDGAGAQDVAGGGTVTYGNLNIIGGGTKLALDAIDVNGNFDNGGSGDVAVSFDLSTFAFTIDGTKENTNATLLFGGANNGVFFNTGTVNYNGDDPVVQTIAASGGAAAYSTLIFSSDAEKSIVNLTTVRTNSGLNVSALSPVTVDGDLVVGVVSGDLTNLGAITVNASGTVSVLNGDLANSGAVTNDGSIFVPAGDFTSSGSVTNNGTITVGI